MIGLLQISSKTKCSNTLNFSQPADEPKILYGEFQSLNFSIFIISYRGVGSSYWKVLWSADLEICPQLSDRRHTVWANATSGHQGFWNPQEGRGTGTVIVHFVEWAKEYFQLKGYFCVGWIVALVIETKQTNKFFGSLKVSLKLVFLWLFKRWF